MSDHLRPTLHETGDDVVAAATAGDEAAFSTLVERHRRELHLHCYRMLRSSDHAEDAVQETFLRAWRARSSFAGRSKFRTWLYCIATNACRDELSRRQRRPQTRMVGAGVDAPVSAHTADLGSYECAMDGFASSDAQPDVVVVAKEDLEQAFIAAIALLPQRQRAALIMRDVLRWSACETARLLDTTVPAVNSALQRARATLDQHRPTQESGGIPSSRLTRDERLLLERYVDALGRADTAAVAELVRGDAQAPERVAGWWLSDAEAVVAA